MVLTLSGALRPLTEPSLMLIEEWIVSCPSIILNRHSLTVVTLAETGVISFFHPKGQGKPVFTCHPIEKPYLIYQIGSADPKLAAQAAATVCQDVSGIDLNCGCPKPFSTTGGMGAALLSTPDLLCDILKAIRAAVPPEVSVSCKIRLMPTEEETLELVRKIVTTGAIRCLTVHCRTRTMRMSHRAEVERLTSIVKLCRELDPELAVIQNGDCVSREAAVKVRELTGCDSVMIATAAESNLSCFREGPLADANTELIPKYVRLASYFGNAWGNSKHCFSQFKSPASVAPVRTTKDEKKNFRERLSQAKYYPDLVPLIGALEGGKEFLDELNVLLAEREVQGRLIHLVKNPPNHDSVDGKSDAPAPVTDSEFPILPPEPLQSSDQPVPVAVA
ncbi:hypothetical protein FRC03_005508 [Tulasnella sp. 419]|nr:hypothetical protein FRC03_005508 [Tulasnella sp. 419]